MAGDALNRNLIRDPAQQNPEDRDFFFADGRAELTSWRDRHQQAYPARPAGGDGFLEGPCRLNYTRLGVVVVDTH